MAAFGDFHVPSVSKKGSPSSRSSARLVLERPGLVFCLRSWRAELPLRRSRCFAQKIRSTHTRGGFGQFYTCAREEGFCIVSLSCV